jgi:hypothetical protein
MGELLAALEASALARSLRESVWSYPLVNTGHILGVALLVGAIAPLDLRLLGAWRTQPLGPLWRVLSATAASGAVVAVVCGGLLFIVRATEYAQSSLFLGKMAVVAVGVANAIALRAFAARSGWLAAADVPIARRVRISAAISLGAWLAALLLGRLIGYF